MIALIVNRRPNEYGEFQMLGLVFHKFGGKGKLINGVQERTGETEGERERGGEN